MCEKLLLVKCSKSKLRTGSCYNYTATKMRRSMLKCINKKNNTKSKFKTGSGYNYTTTKMRRSMLKCSNKKNNVNIFFS